MFIPSCRQIVELVICRYGARQKNRPAKQILLTRAQILPQSLRARKRLSRWALDPIHSATTRQVFQFTQTTRFMMTNSLNGKQSHNARLSHRRLACVCVHHLRMPVADFETPFPDRAHHICPLSFSIRESATSSYIRNAFAHPSIRTTDNAICRHIRIAGKLALNR